MLLIKRHDYCPKSFHNYLLSSEKFYHINDIGYLSVIKRLNLKIVKFNSYHVTSLTQYIYYKFGSNLQDEWITMHFVTKERVQLTLEPHRSPGSSTPRSVENPHVNFDFSKTWLIAIVDKKPYRQHRQLINTYLYAICLSTYILCIHNLPIFLIFLHISRLHGSSASFKLSQNFKEFF